MGTRRRAVLILAAGWALPACSGPPPGPAWRAVALPGGGAPVLGDLVHCATRWYAVGGVDGARPAAWSSVDGAQWTDVPVHPVSAYGPQQVYASAACAGDRLAAVGLTAGGVHSNPRINTWYGGVGGLTEVPSGLDLYGGDEAVALSRIAGGAPGFVIAGQRSSGAVAWVSPDGAGFTRIVADLDRTSAAADAAAVDRGWLLVGSRTPAGAPRSARDPAAWYSADGGRTWRAEAPPSTVDEDEALSRVVPLPGGGALAVGVRGTGFGAWRRVPGSGWRAVGRFGRFGGTAVPVVSGLAGTPDGHVYAAVSDGSGYQLWSTADGGSWRRLDVPVRLPAGPGRRLLVAGDGARLLLGAQDGRTARLWLAQRGS